MIYYKIGKTSSGRLLCNDIVTVESDSRRKSLLIDQSFVPYLYGGNNYYNPTSHLATPALLGNLELSNSEAPTFGVHFGFAPSS